MENWSQIDYDIDTVSRKKIAIVFETEMSLWYRIYEYLVLNMEYLLRFYYAWIFFFYFGV